MKFSISILTYNQIAHAKRCIESVMANSVEHEYELILTSNGSRDWSDFIIDWPVAAGGHCVLNKENEGFILANNHALTLATGEYLVLLNDDATVPPGWLNTLEAPFLDDPKCAITGAAGACCSLDLNFHGYRGIKVEYVEGSCLCIKTELARKHGLFDEELKMGCGEDADLCLRMRSLGYTIHQADFKLASHVGGATIRTIPGMGDTIRRNLDFCKKRWAEYLKTHSFPHEK